MMNVIIQYSVIVALFIFAIWYVSGMVKDSFFSKKKDKKGCDKCK